MNRDFTVAQLSHLLLSVDGELSANGDLGRAGIAFIPLIFWLLIKGVDVQKWRTMASHAS